MIKSKEAKKGRKKFNRTDEILKAAEVLFAEKGFYLTTLEEIARTADLAKGTIYLHFQNKRDLFISVIEKKLDILLEKIRRGIQEESLPSNKIKKAIETHLKFLEQNRNFFKILQGLSGEYKREMEKELTERVIQKNARYLGILQQLIQQAIERKEVKPLNARKLAVILVGMVHSLTINWITREERGSLSEDRRLVWEIFWNGAKLED